MKKLFLIGLISLLLLFLKARFINEKIFTEKIFSTSTTTTRIQENVIKEKKPLLVIISKNILIQGDTLLIKIFNAEENTKIKGEFNEKIFDFAPFNNAQELIGVVGIDINTKPGNYYLKIYNDNKEIFNEKITVNKGNFYVTKFILNKDLEDKGYTQSNIVQNIEAKDNALIYKALATSTSNLYFKQPFIYPLDKIIKVGDFGTIRKEGNISLRHLGVDLEAPLNTPVYAINDGIVKFAQNLSTYGKTIIIDHGFGIYSLYLHLNDFKVKENERVKRGEVIGLSGNTGYSLSPHLHFSVKIQGITVEPLNFIEEFNKIITKEIN